ncbi:lipopolysaccharide-induced transcription factor regulating tumor necrosis factor alpha [Cryptosporidium sp. chipmunk genotype I]|uniref:lipopolysaccharide-induced transcription factor regulating tumor necrosis factor alpha n=1 Tax=Cryptosporidium sp. chipmunk genotype I TaxID=1280935 RepID=UPI003519E083|nr:lipopolysaccharide-induced transcription factor regulating tumor necrosis factor alpha [Cryptosporidium sp. chipmunk genotype I]
MVAQGKLIHFEVEPVKHGEEIEENSNVKFEDIPVECTCPFCKEDIVTQVELESSWFTYFASVALFLVIGWISCPILPLIWTLIQDSVHTCPRCLNKISRNRRIKCPSIKSEIMTLKCGSCAVVLTRRYVITILLIFSTIIIFTTLRTLLKIYGLPDIEHGPPIDNTWMMFIESCGVKSYLGNPIRAVREFEDSYQYKTVSWTGRVIKVQEGFWKKHFIYIGMNPPQIVTNSGNPIPDLGLTFNENLLTQISKIKPGDLLDFNATLVEFGKRGHPHFGQMWNFTKLDDEFNMIDALLPKQKSLLLMIPLIEMMNQLSEQLSKPIGSDDSDKQSSGHEGILNSNIQDIKEFDITKRFHEEAYRLPESSSSSMDEADKIVDK